MNLQVAYIRDCVTREFGAYVRSRTLVATVGRPTLLAWRRKRRMVSVVILLFSPETKGKELVPQLTLIDARDSARRPVNPAGALCL